MRIVVYPHDLSVGGSQLNAIEIAATLRARGHECIVFGPNGPLVDRVRQLGLEFIESPDPRRRPSPAVVRALTNLVQERQVDVIHGYEWPPILEATLAARSRDRTAVVGTVMSMAVAPFLPKSVDLVVGTAQIAAVERASGRLHVEVIEPPVDLVHNDPADVSGLDEFRAEWGLTPDRLTVVCVTRFAQQLKLEGLLTAIRVVSELAESVPVRLLVVGDGPARATVEAAAATANALHGDGCVVLTGELSDPRPAYAVADLSLGMGGSALRALAFGAPLVVQGENGYWRLLTPESEPEFRWAGWYGYGEDADCGADELRKILDDLLPDAPRRAHLGAYGSSLVHDDFSVEHAADLQLAVYEGAVQRACGPGIPDLARAGVGYLAYQGRRKLARALGRGAADDFNARPVARSDAPAARRPATTASPAVGRNDAVLVYLAGAPWDAVTGTDRHLAVELAAHGPVLWVDPPVSWWSRRRRGQTTPPVSTVGQGIVRVHTVVLPGVSRPVLRDVAQVQVLAHARRVLSRSAHRVAAVVASSPEAALRGWRGVAPTIYYATDDFVAGARILGTSVRHASRARTSNLRSADLTVAVTEELAAILRRSGHPAGVLANGCHPALFADVDRLVPATTTLASPVAGVVGQLNDRLDIGLLEAVARSGTSVLLVGPRYEEQPQTIARLDGLIELDNVEWVGRQPFEDLPSWMAAIDVGLTPYLDTPFNRASAPLKTLEYLAAGLPVVSTDLPAARALDTAHVRLARTSHGFVDEVNEALRESGTPAARAERREIARGQSWAARAEQLESMIAMLSEESDR